MAGIFILRQYLFHPSSNKNLKYFLQNVLYDSSTATQKQLKEIDRPGNK